MKRLFYIICLSTMTALGFAQTPQIIKLSPPDTLRGIPVMKALTHRASASSYDTAEMKINDISDLLWAANGINRPESGKRTAASSYNSQDIDLYLFLKTGVYIYNPKEHQIELLTSGDHRHLIAATQPFVNDARQIILLVSDISRFKKGEESEKLHWAAIDAGIVAQNIMIFCSSEGFLARPRVFMEKEKIRQVLNLNKDQHPILNIPVSYRK
jgi:SagB-type dehydrogenase family enzyme